MRSMLTRQCMIKIYTEIEVYKKRKKKRRKKEEKKVTDC